MNPHGRYFRLPDARNPVPAYITPLITTCPSCQDHSLEYTEYPATACAFPAEHYRECETCEQYSQDEMAAWIREGIEEAIFLRNDTGPVYRTDFAEQDDEP